MSTKSTEVWSGEHLERMRQALRSGESREGGIKRYEVAGLIQEILERKYMMGINPLPAIRNSFPEFHWKFKKIPSQTPIHRFGDVRKQIISAADYFWDAFGAGNDNCRFVLARLIGATHPPLMIYATCSFNELIVDHYMDDYVAELKAMGAREMARG